MYGEVEISSEFLMASQVVEAEHCKNCNVAGFSLEFECLDDGQGPKRQNCELECEDGGKRRRCEKAAVDGSGPVVETMAQNWTSLDREGRHEHSVCHKKTCAQLGWTCGQDGPQRNLCEGLEMPRPPMVELETTPLERSGERQMVWPTPTAIQNLPVGGHGCWGSIQVHRKCRRFVGSCPIKHGVVAYCSKTRKLETVFEMWKEPSIDGPGCLGDPCASGMTWTNAGATWSTRESKVKWCRAGCGWLDSYCSWYGRRGCWSGIPENVWFCETCRMALWRSGAKVLSWNVSGNEFLSQSSLLETGVLKLGMTDVFHVGELIPRPKTMKDMNEPMRARAMHMMVINTWMIPNTEQKICTAHCP